MGIGSYYIPLAIYLGGIAMALSTIFIKKELGLMYLVLFMPLQNIKEKIHIFPFGKDFYDILILALIISCFIGKGEKNRIFEKSPANVLLYAYISATFISLILGYINLGIDLPLSEFDDRLKDWKNLILLPIIFFVTLNSVRDRKWIKLILLTGMISVLFTDCLFYREYRWYKSWNYSHAMRVGGPFTYLGPNELGAFFAQYGVFLSAFFLFSRKKWEKILVGGILMVDFYCVMYSFSRAGYLGILAGLAFVCFFQSKKLLIALFVLVLSASSILPDSVMQRIEMTTLTEEQKVAAERAEGGVGGSEKEPRFDASAEGRFGAWDKALEMFFENPLFGYGLATFKYIHHVDTHGNFMKTLAELGIVGFSIYVILYYVAFKNGWALYQNARDRELKGLGLGFAGCVITNIVVNTTHDNWSYFNLMGFYWVLWGLVVRSRMILEDELREEGKKGL